MENNTWITVIIVVVVVAAVGLLGWWGIATWQPAPNSTGNPPPGTTSGGSQQSGGQGTQSQSVSDESITMYYPQDFGLAVTPQQVLVKSYIPPCDQNFDYCFYYNGNQYQGTNFESAGLRVAKRADLGTERLCLNTPPAGFSATTAPENTVSKDSYSMSVFGNVGQAAAGHYSTGSLYRLYLRNSGNCYEFETRVGETQFANYPSGTIKQFTDQDQAAMRQRLVDVLKGFTLADGQQLQLPGQ